MDVNADVQHRITIKKERKREVENWLPNIFEAGRSATPHDGVMEETDRLRFCVGGGGVHA